MNELYKEMIKKARTGKVEMEEDCQHIDMIQDVSPSTTEGCEECLKIGDEWVHLRLCLLCGKVGCCNNSKNKHATAHFKETGHAMVTSFEPGEEWIWCYTDEVMILPS